VTTQQWLPRSLVWKFRSQWRCEVPHSGVCNRVWDGYEYVCLEAVHHIMRAGRS
jgi:hypothetical protein